MRSSRGSSRSFTRKRNTLRWNTATMEIIMTFRRITFRFPRRRTPPPVHRMSTPARWNMTRIPAHIPRTGSSTRDIPRFLRRNIRRSLRRVTRPMCLAFTDPILPRIPFLCMQDQLVPCSLGDLGSEIDPYFPGKGSRILLDIGFVLGQ